MFRKKIIKKMFVLNLTTYFHCGTEQKTKLLCSYNYNLNFKITIELGLKYKDIMCMGYCAIVNKLSA